MRRRSRYVEQAAPDLAENRRRQQELGEKLRMLRQDRAPTPQVVRNTLASLVAKGKIRRHQQERPVSYTLVGSPGTSTAAQSG